MQNGECMVCDLCRHPLQSIFQVLPNAGPAYLHTKCYVGLAGYMNTMDALEQVVLLWRRMCWRRQKTVGRAIMFVRRWQRDEACMRWAQEALEVLRGRFACWREEMLCSFCWAIQPFYCLSLIFPCPNSIRQLHPCIFWMQQARY